MRFAIALLSLLPSLVHAAPSGASQCIADEASVSGAHLTTMPVTNPTFAEQGYEFVINLGAVASETVVGADPIGLTLGGSYTLSVRATGDASFRGALIRLSADLGTMEAGENARLADDVCGTLPAVTHMDGMDKDTLTGSITFDTEGTAMVDVTIVEHNNAIDGSSYSYQQFSIAVLPLEEEATVAPTTMAPTMMPTTAAPTMAPITMAPTMAPITEAPTMVPALITAFPVVVQTEAPVPSLMNLPTFPAQAETKESNSPTIALVGGLVGAILMLIIVAVLYLKSRSQRNSGDKDGTPTAQGYTPSSHNLPVAQMLESTMNEAHVVAIVEDARETPSEPKHVQNKAPGQALHNTSVPDFKDQARA